MDKDLLNKLIELAKEFQVTKLVQFGSSIDSIEKSNDIDLACDGLNDKKFFRFGARVEKLFNKPVDLLPLEPKDRLTEYILKNGRVIYESASD